MARWKRHLAETYFAIDPRSLGLFRIGLGLVLLLDLARRWRSLSFFYTNDGLLPNHTLLWRPAAEHTFSLFFTVSTEAEAQLAFVLCALVYLAFTFGFRTRLMQWLALICRVSLNSRLAVLENGGDMVVNLLALFTLALPLGQRFSIDALLAAARAPASPANGEHVPTPTDRNAPVFSLAVFGLLLQFSLVYFFNAVSKSGHAWRQGTAVHYALHQDKLVTGLGVWMRENLSLPQLTFLARSTLVVEWIAPVLILTPIFTTQARLIAVCTLPFLHAGFALGLNLGGFTPAMIAFYPLLLRAEHWRAAPRALRALHARWSERAVRALRVRLERGSWLLPMAPAARPASKTRLGYWLTQAAVATLMVAIGIEIVNDNASVPKAMRVPRTAWSRAIIEYPRILQGWRMFAPDAPHNDGMIYVDAVTAEGRHVDPYNEVASRVASPAGKRVPAFLDQDQYFVMYSDRIPNQNYGAYRHAFHEWLLAYPKRTGKQDDCLLSFEVYFVSDKSPEPGSRAEPTPLEHTRFMNYEAPKGSPCRVRATTRGDKSAGPVASSSAER